MKGLWRANPLGDAIFPNWNLFPKFGITRFYAPVLALDTTTGKWIPNEKEMNLQYANDIRSHDIEFAPYFDPSWVSLHDPLKIADVLSQAVAVTGSRHCMLDCEYHEASDLIVEIIYAYRSMVRQGGFAWTMEPWQAGWMSTRLVNRVNNDINCVLVVQNFFGDMSPAGTRNNMTPRRELVRRGFAENRVKTFYDGKLALPPNWDGCILSEERLTA